MTTGSIVPMAVTSNVVTNPFTFILLTVIDPGSLGGFVSVCVQNIEAGNFIIIKILISFYIFI